MREGRKEERSNEGKLKSEKGKEWTQECEKGEKGAFRLKEEIGKLQAKLFIFPTITLCFMTVRAATVCERLLSAVLAPLKRQYQYSSVGGNTKLNEW